MSYSRTYYVSSRLPWRDISQPSVEVEHLKTLLEAGSIKRHEACSEVYPGIILGDESTALSSYTLRSLGVTHVLNAAAPDLTKDPRIDQRYTCGAVRTSQTYYDHLGIRYYGIPAVDIVSYNLSRHFSEAADFIDEALRRGGKILVHCQMGISRSASIVIAYLMIKKGMSVDDATKTVRNPWSVSWFLYSDGSFRSKRLIYPNDGFLRQLCQLNQRQSTSRRLRRY